ncbi:hypothetical protein Q3G72_031814 [Acer saccharum]|nr:hypothetical protein Q3G72_031814 [Acer saccharum]
MSGMNCWLQKRGIPFSSKYLGDKYVLWVLESDYVSEEFNMSRFLWDDCFVTMRRWSRSATPQARLAWVNCMGVPLNVWCAPFFNKLIKVFGEAVLVDEDNISRNILDKGR